ncbi:MAG TPA: AI-2E family transporter [Candidatus Baltobacteraceae bacterium]|jgi:predicted PurR-regulated permease PerM
MSGAISAFVLLFMGVLIAAALRPVVDRLGSRMPFGAAVGVTFGAVFLIVAIIDYMMIAPLGGQFQRLLLDVPGYVKSLQAELAAAQRFVKSDQLSRQFAGALAGSAAGALSSAGAHIVAGSTLVASVVGDTVIVVLLAIGWTLSSDQLASFALGLLPAPRRHDWKHAFDTIGTRLGAYAQGVVINGTVVGVTIGVALALLGVPYGLLLAFVAGLLQALPMLGAVISGPIVVLVVLATAGWTKMLIVLAVFIGMQVIDQSVISPIIFGQRVQLSFLLVIFSTVLGGALLGIPGAFLAVPAAAALEVVVVQIIAPAIRRSNGV